MTIFKIEFNRILFYFDIIILMKNKSKFIAELLFTVLVAGVVSSGLGLLLAFIFGNLGQHQQAYPSINAAAGVFFGLIIGYKLNTLIRTHKS